MIDYFWELETPFANFLQSIFPTYYRKFSLTGSGIYNLIKLNDKIYEIKFKQAKSFVKEDNKLTKDENKNFILEEICNALNEKGIAYTINSGKFISFKQHQFICKVEIIKKLKEPV